MHNILYISWIWNFIFLCKICWFFFVLISCFLCYIVYIWWIWNAMFLCIILGFLLWFLEEYETLSRSDFFCLNFQTLFLAPLKQYLYKHRNTKCSKQQIGEHKIHNNIENIETQDINKEKHWKQQRKQHQICKKMDCFA